MAGQKLAGGGAEEAGEADAGGGGVLKSFSFQGKYIAWTLIVGIASLLLAWQFFFPWVGTRDAKLFELLSEIEDAQPIVTRNSIPHLPCETPYASGSESCWSKAVKFENLTIDEVDFRPQTDGSILVLDGLGPNCVDQKLTFKRYPGGTIENSCDHKYCPYYKVKRSWGQIAFALPTDSSRDFCIVSAVFESGARD